MVEEQCGGLLKRHTAYVNDRKSPEYLELEEFFRVWLFKGSDGDGRAPARSPARTLSLAKVESHTPL